MTLSVLVTGANGFIGSAVCREFLRRGALVYGLIREGADTAMLPTAVERLYGEFHQEADAEAALRESNPEIILHVAAIVSTGRPDAELSWQVNVEGTRQFARAASRHGVSRWIQLSSMSAHAANKSVYGTTKFYSESAVRESGLPFTIIRPSLVYGSEKRGIFYKLVSIQRELPVLPLVGNGNEPMRPVHVDDLAWLVAEASYREEAIGRTYDAGGPEDWTLSDMLMATARLMKMRARFLPVPLPVCRATALVGENLSKSPPLTSDNIEGISRARMPRIDAACEELGFEPRSFETGFKEGRT